MIKQLLLKPLHKKCEQFMYKKLDKEHYRKITDTEDKDVFIAGYPKSGNTWMQNLVASLVFGIDGKLLPDALTKEIIPDVHYKKFYKRLLDECIFKTHDLPKPQYKRVIYIVRDPRDVMSSYYAMQKNFIQGCTLEDMVVHGKHIVPSKWHIHTQQWHENPYKAEIIKIRYEDLLNDSFNQMRKICDFIGVERSDAQITAAIDGNAFSNMRAKESKFGVEAFPSKDKTASQEEAKFFRKGKVGSYKDDLPEKYIEFINKECQEQMKLFSYS